MIKYLKPLQLFQESMKRTLDMPPAVFLGLNVSDKFVSLAFSDDFKIGAHEYGILRRDENLLNNLVDNVQEFMSEYNLEGIIIGSKYPVSPPVNIHTLMDDLSKKGKIESLKYTYLKDNFTSPTAVVKCNKFIDMVHDYSRFAGDSAILENVNDMLPATHMLQACLDVFNALVQTEISKLHMESRIQWNRKLAQGF